MSKQRKAKRSKSKNDPQIQTIEDIEVSITTMDYQIGRLNALLAQAFGELATKLEHLSE